MPPIIPAATSSNFERWNVEFFFLQKFFSIHFIVRRVKREERYRDPKSDALSTVNIIKQLSRLARRSLPPGTRTMGLAHDDNVLYLRPEGVQAISELLFNNNPRCFVDF